MADSKEEQIEGWHVMKFGLGAPENWDDFAEQVMAQRVELWNALVGLANLNKNQFQALCRKQDPDIAELEESIEKLDKRFKQLNSQRAAERKAAKSASGSGKELNKEIAETFQLRREIGKELANKRRKATDAVKPQQKELNLQFQKSVQAACTASSLWWPIAESLKKDFEKALAEVRRTNRKFRPKTFEKNGAFAARASGGVSFSDICAGQCTWLKIDPVSDLAWVDNSKQSRKIRQTKLHLLIGKSKNEKGKAIKHWVTFPIYLHRKIEPDTLLTSIRVSRRACGTRELWSASMNFKGYAHEPDLLTLEQKMSKIDTVSAIDVGWSMEPEGLKFATCMSINGKEQKFYLSQEWLDKNKYTYELRSLVDQKLLILKESISPMLTKHQRGPEFLNILRQWARGKLPSHEEFMKWSTLWEKESPDFEPVLLAKVVAARKEVFKAIDEAANLRRKLKAQRSALFQEITKSIAKTHARVYVENFSLANMAAKTDDRGYEKENKRGVRRAQKLADISDFRKWLEHMARKHNCGLIYVPTKDLNRTCANCNHVHDEKPVNGVTTCPLCGNRYKREQNACANLIKRGEVTRRALTATDEQSEEEQ